MNREAKLKNKIVASLGLSLGLSLAFSDYAEQGLFHLNQSADTGAGLRAVNRSIASPAEYRDMGAFDDPSRYPDREEEAYKGKLRLGEQQLGGSATYIEDYLVRGMKRLEEDYAYKREGHTNNYRAADLAFQRFSSAVRKRVNGVVVNQALSQSDVQALINQFNATGQSKQLSELQMALTDVATFVSRDYIRHSKLLGWLQELAKFTGPGGAVFPNAGVILEELATYKTDEDLSKVTKQYYKVPGPLGVKISKMEDRLLDRERNALAQLDEALYEKLDQWNDLGCPDISQFVSEKEMNAASYENLRRGLDLARSAVDQDYKYYSAMKGRAYMLDRRWRPWLDVLRSNGIAWNRSDWPGVLENLFPDTERDRQQDAYDEIEDERRPQVDKYVKRAFGLEEGDQAVDTITEAINTTYTPEYLGKYSEQLFTLAGFPQDPDKSDKKIAISSTDGTASGGLMLSRNDMRAKYGKYIRFRDLVKPEFANLYANYGSISGFHRTPIADFNYEKYLELKGGVQDIMEKVLGARVEKFYFSDMKNVQVLDDLQARIHALTPEQKIEYQGSGELPNYGKRENARRISRLAAEARQRMQLYAGSCAELEKDFMAVADKIHERRTLGAADLEELVKQIGLKRDAYPYKSPSNQTAPTGTMALPAFAAPPM